MEPFDWSKYQAANAAPTSSTGFNWDKYQPPDEKMNPAVAGLLGLGRGATMDFGDELAGASGAMLAHVLPESLGGGTDGKSWRELYREYRDFARKQNDKGARDQPLATGVGTLAGGIATSYLGGAAAAELGGTAKLLSVLGKAAPAVGAIGEGATYGALSGLGGSDADLTKGEFGKAASDTGHGALTGAEFGLGGHIVGATLPYLAKGASKLGSVAARGALSHGADVGKLSSEAVQAAYDAGAFTRPRMISGTSNKLDEVRAALGAAKGQLEADWGARGLTADNALDLARGLEGEGRRVASTTGGSPTPKAFFDLADEIAPGISTARDEIRTQLARQGIRGKHADALVEEGMRDWQPDLIAKRVDAKGNLSLADAENIKGTLQDNASAAYKEAGGSPKGDALKAVAAYIKKANDAAVNRQRSLAPELADKWVPLKEKLGNLIEASNAARAGAKKSDPLINTLLGTSAVGGLLAGNLAPAGAALAGYAGRELGPSTAAWALPHIANGLASPKTAKLIQLLRNTGALTAGENVR